MKLIFDHPSDGTELVRTVTGSSPPSTVPVRFEPSPNEQLIGQPSAWCNSPSTGQPLIFDVPVPLTAGDPDAVGTLEARPASGSVAVMIKIKVRHPS